jgi:hypothetical protein
MGTRGFVGFVVDGTEKISYNHWDSYPCGVGLNVLEWLRGVVADNEDQQRELAKTLAAVDEDASPTDEQLKRFSEFHNPNVSRGNDWYALLRETQGKPGEILKAGFYCDAKEFPLDSLFCEWGYLIDFDNRVLEVYEGFQQTQPTEGRWAHETGTTNGYAPVKRVATFAFDALPADAEFLVLDRDED